MLLGDFSFLLVLDYWYITIFVVKVNVALCKGNFWPDIWNMKNNAMYILCKVQFNGACILPCFG